MAGSIADDLARTRRYRRRTRILPPMRADGATKGGLDHGDWVPLRQMLHDAGVPVVPLSVQHQGGPQHAYRAGQALAPLAQQGLLILA